MSGPRVPRFRLDICLLPAAPFFGYLRSRRFAKSSHIKITFLKRSHQRNVITRPPQLLILFFIVTINTFFCFLFVCFLGFLPGPKCRRAACGRPTLYRWRLGSIHHGCGRLPCFSVPAPCGPPPFGCPVYIEPLPLSNIDSARMGRCFSGLRHRLSI